jgi:hypothetical protein
MWEGVANKFEGQDYHLFFINIEISDVLIKESASNTTAVEKI